MELKNYLTDAINIVDAADKKTKIAIWCALSRYKIPSELRGLLPDNYESFDLYIKFDIAMIIMGRINESVGINECLHAGINDMTNCNPVDK